MDIVLRRAQALSLSQKLFFLCMFYVSIALVLFPQTFLALFSQYPIVRLLIVAPLFAILGLVGAAITQSPKAPLTFLRMKLRDRGLPALIILATFIVATAAFTTLKHEYSKLVPFFADPALATMDRLLHFGDPWIWARAVVPEGFDRTFFYLYSALWFLQVVATVVFAAFVADRFTRERYLASFAVSVIGLSSIVRLAGSSGGPIFYDRLHGGTRFADLTASLQASPAGPDVLSLTNYLYDSYASNTMVLGTGISAMPSLHVALAFLNALFISSLHRVAGALAWAYAAFVLFGSVYFGWHYALDGYVSIAVVCAIWWYFSRHKPLSS